VVYTATLASFPSFDSLNNNCLVNVLSHVSSDEMNNIAFVNRSCREARSSDSLNQTGTRTIILREGATPSSICDAIIRGQWNAFADNRTSLKIEKIGYLKALITTVLPHGARLNGVDSLSLRGEILESQRIHLVFRLLPKLRNVNLNCILTSLHISSEILLQELL
jgi:hypothetical protein